MGTLNLASLIAKVQRFYADREDLSDDEVTDYLNLAQEQMAKEDDWEEFENTLEGNFSITSSAKDDKFITVATTTKEVTSFRIIKSDGRSRKIRYVPVRAFDLDIPEPEYYARRTPTRYTLHNGKIELWPVPDEADPYIIRTIKWPTDFSSDTSVKSDFDKKDLALIYRAASIISDSFGEYERAGRFYGIYNSLVQKDLTENARKPDREIKPPSEHRRSSGHSGDQYWVDPFVKDVR